MEQLLIHFQRLFGDGLPIGLDLFAAPLHDAAVDFIGFIGAIHAQTTEDEAIQVRLEVAIIDARLLQSPKQLATLQLLANEVKRLLGLLWKFYERVFECSGLHSCILLFN